MKLKSVSVAGFRSISDLGPLDLRSPTVLAGHNDAGKSAIIHAILFLLGGYTLTEGDRTYVSDSSAAVATEDDPIERVSETFAIGTFDLDDSEAEQFGTTQITIRRIARNGAKATLEQLASVPANPLLRELDSLKLAELEGRLKDLGLDSSKATKSVYVKRLEEAAESAQKVDEWIAATPALDKALPEARRFDAASAVDAEVAIRDALATNYKAHLNSEDLRGNVRTIEEDLERLLASDAHAMRQHIMDKVRDIGEVTIQPSVSFGSANGLKATEISVRNRAGESINLNFSGAGRARRVALAVWEYNASLLAESGEDVVLLYDEPDTHLDYGHQRELMRLIHEQTLNPKVTVVIASHSMNLIDGTDISDVVHVKHQNHRTVIERLADDTAVGSHLGAIAASVGLRNTVLLHERLFIGVEGASEARALPVLFKLATGRHLESCGMALWPCGNNEGARHFAAFLHERGRNVVFLVDDDSRTNSKHVFNPDKLRLAGLDPDKQCLYVGQPSEIEDIFTDEQWATAANKLWPRVDGSAWTEEHFAEHRAGKFSKDILEELRNCSIDGPGGKPDMLSGLALSFDSEEDVPVSLRAHFEALIEMAQ